MSSKQSVAPWKGGFAESNPAFAYPEPNLSSLPMLDNMDNIKLLQRQQAVKWPEFSWETEKGSPDPKRCYRMFAPYISRIGYTAEGRVYSIICPQQGVYVPKIGTINIEITVTGQRGWVNETTKELAADMTVEGKIWFSRDSHTSLLVKALWLAFRLSKHKFPSSKKNAIVVTTHKLGDPSQPVFPVRKGVSDLFPNPDFANHEKEAWTVGNVAVEVGPIKKTNDPVVDEFNQRVLDLFNMVSGNILQNGNLLSWNVWFTAPELVDQKEWKTHADRWRKSIDEEHKSPDGEGTPIRYFDGTPFNAKQELVEELVEKLVEWLHTRH